VKQLAGAAALLMVACGSPSVSSAPASTDASASGPCAASALAVTGTRGERLHPRVLPIGFTLESFYDEADLGAMHMLMYTTPGSGDRPWLELGRRHSAIPLSSLMGINQSEPVTIQGKAGLQFAGPPQGSGDIAIDWTESIGVILFVTAHNVPASEVLAVANNLQYVPGTSLTYPTRPRVTVSKRQAQSLLPGAGSSPQAVLTSFGEVDAVTSLPPINHVSVLNPSVEVTRPVWVVWTRTKEDVKKTVVVDANSSVKLAELTGVPAASLLSLTDRSAASCEPPFGVLTRREIGYLIPTPPQITSTLKLMTLGTLRGTKEGSFVGNCNLVICDLQTVVWVWSASATDCSLMFRCGPPGPFAQAGPTPPPGSWAIRTFDARTGPQSTELSAIPSGHGQLPLDVANLPDMAPAS